MDETAPIQPTTPEPQTEATPAVESTKPLTLGDFIKKAEADAKPEPEKVAAKAETPDNPLFDNLDLLDALSPEAQLRLAKERGFHSGGDKTAYEFLKGGNIKNIISTKMMLKELADQNRKILAQQEAVVTNARQQERERTIAELEAKAIEAAAIGDQDAVNKAFKAQREFLEKDKPAPAQTADMHPVFKAFHENNKWYGQDMSMSQAFDSIYRPLVEQHGVHPLVAVKEAEKRFGEYFPEFKPKPEAKAEEEKPHKPPVNPNAGSSKSITGGSSGVRSEASLNDNGRGTIDVLLKSIEKRGGYTDADKKRAVSNAIKTFPQSFFS